MAEIRTIKGPVDSRSVLEARDLALISNFARAVRLSPEQRKVLEKTAAGFRTDTTPFWGKNIQAASREKDVDLFVENLLRERARKASPKPACMTAANSRRRPVPK